MSQIPIAEAPLLQSPSPALQTSGYSHRDYAFALSEFGTPTLLPCSGGWFLKRQIAGSSWEDGMGCYPLFSCYDWSGLKTDLESVDLVSFAAVLDPFSGLEEPFMRECFPDVAFIFKQHFVTDLQQSPKTFVAPHHMRNVKKALGRVSVEQCSNPATALEDWHRLYLVLVQRHSIRGISAFSKASFAKQLCVPGMVAFQAMHEGEVVGMLLWYVQRGVAYYHLGAYSDKGYELRASFALFWHAMEHFAASGTRWLCLGAGAGASSDATDGLTLFKKGWSTGTRAAYFCGRIFSRTQYDALVAARNIPETKYFPAYRKGEFA